MEGTSSAACQLKLASGKQSSSGCMRVSSADLACCVCVCVCTQDAEIMARIYSRMLKAKERLGMEAVKGYLPDGSLGYVLTHTHTHTHIHTQRRVGAGACRQTYSVRICYKDVVPVS